MSIATMVRRLPLRRVEAGRVRVRDWSGLPTALRDRAHVILPPMRLSDRAWYVVGEFRTRADGSFTAVAAQRIPGRAVIYGLVMCDASGVPAESRERTGRIIPEVSPGGHDGNAGPQVLPDVPSGTRRMTYAEACATRDQALSAYRRSIDAAPDSCKDLMRRDMVTLERDYAGWIAANFPGRA